jgi:outer membrane protein TolC
MFAKWMAIGVLVSAAAAQDAPLRLTLKDAVQMALKENPQVVLANLNVAQSEKDQQLARAGLLPQVSGNMAETVNRVNINAFLGTSFPGFTQHAGPFWVFQSGVTFNAPVFDLTLWRRYQSSRLGVDATRAQERSAREENVLLVVSQYLGAQRAQANVTAAKSRVDLAQALYDQAADLQKNGAGTGIDTLRANVELQNEKQRQITAQTDLDTSLFALGRLLNLDPHRNIELADNVSFFETQAVAADQTIEQAYAARPELKQIASARARAALDLRSAGDERLPKVAVHGYWAEQGLGPNTVIPVYQYQFSLDVPIFTGGRIGAEQAKDQIAIKQLDQQERDARAAIALEVRNAVALLDAARHEVEVANLGVQLARQEVDQARDRFQAGVANNIEVVTAQDALARANDNQIAALYRFNQARADVAHATGRMEELYAR